MKARVLLFLLLVLSVTLILVGCSFLPGVGTPATTTGDTTTAATTTAPVTTVITTTAPTTTAPVTTATTTTAPTTTAPVTTAPVTTAPVTTTAPVPAGLSFSPIGEDAYKVSDYTGNATELTIPSTYLGKPVTGIVSSAFYGCSSLTSVTIGEGVTSIGLGAFYGCSSLTSVTIPDSVKSIGEWAFAWCESLTSVTIREEVESIGSYAFSSCTSLTIYCEATSKPAGWDSDWNSSNCPVVWNCNTNDVANNGYIYTTIDGVRYALKDGEASVAEQPQSITAATIPTSVAYKGSTYPVTSIGISAFYGCSSLTSVTIPDSVTSIGISAFYGCSSLTSINIPDSVTSIGGSAFYGCTSLTIYCEATSKPAGWDSNWNYSYCPVLWNSIPDGLSFSPIGEDAYEVSNYYGAATELTIPATYLGKPVTSIGDEAFYGCSSLTSVTIPDSVKSIGDSAFYNCDSLASVTIGENVTNIEEGTFAFCTSLTSVTIPDSVKSIGDEAFYHCTSLTSVTIPDSVTSIGRWAFDGCSSLQYTTYGNAQYLGNSANPYVVLVKATSTDITSATIHENTKVIGGSAFYYCTSLTSVTIPDSVTSIGDYAFQHCTSLTSVTIPDSVTSIGGSAFEGCSSLTSITIPDSVTSIGEEAFYYCSSLTIYCEAMSKPTGWSSNWNPDGCPVVWKCNTNEVANDGYIYTVIDGLRYALKDGVASVVVQPSSIKEATIPATVIYKGNTYAVTSIGDYAFSGCTSLASVTIPDSVKSIGYVAFSGCASLTSVTIPDSVTSIGFGAFSLCKSLTSVTIGDSVKSILNAAFSGCASLTSVTIPDSVKSIGGSAFEDCSSLTWVTIPDSVTSIGSYAFKDCSSLTWVTIPDSVTSIGSYAFKDCSSLTIYCEAATKPAGWVSNWNSLNYPVVWNCSTNEVADDGYIYAVVGGLRYALKDGVAAVVAQPSSIKEATIPATVTYGENTYPVASIGDYAFSGCTSLTSVTIPDSVKSIGDYAFSGCTSLTSVTIPDGVGVIGDRAFYDCDSLTSVTIPGSVESIGDEAFKDCSSLTIYCEATSKPAGWNSGWNSSNYPVVWDCNNNEVADDGYIYAVIDGLRYALKDGEASVAEQPQSITAATIPTSVAYKGSTYPVTSIGDYAFSGCTSLTSVTIPDGVGVIGDRAFSGCSSLTAITIPDSVTSIGGSAFSGCSSLTIFCEATSKPAGWNSGWNYSNYCPVVWGYTGE